MSSDASDSSYRNPVEELAEEFAARVRRGEKPTIDEYVDRHPDMADQIRDLFPAMLMMERIGADVTEDSPGAAADETLSIERVGDYHIVRELGRGGMGIVYEAEQESLGRRVALKVMLPSVLIDPRQLERFEREARSVARLHHTNIVPVYGVGHTDGLHYFVMQLIDGQGLDKVLVDLRRLRDRKEMRDVSQAASELLSGNAVRGARQGNSGDEPPHPAPLPYEAHARGKEKTPSSDAAHGKPPSGISSGSESGTNYFRAVATLGIQAAEALHYAHDQGLLHRDVKPSNLLLDSRGALWVTDFGLAKEKDADDLTLTGDIVGTLRYMAPERFENQCTAQSDIYGLGLTLYELLTMQPAYEESDRATLVARVMNDAPPSPRRVDRNIPRDLETIVLKAIAREPQERYSSAEELAEDLRRFLEDRPIQARRASVPERAWRWCRRNPAVAMLTASVVALLIVVTVAYINTLGALQEARDARSGETEALAQAKQRAIEAEAAERDAANAVDEYFTKVSENQLLGVPGMEGLRRELLTLALRYYDTLTQRSGGKDPQLQLELAVAHERVALINSLIGSSGAAIRSYESAIEIIASLRRADPDAMNLAMQEARCHRRLGISLRVASRLEEAEQHLDAAIDLYGTDSTDASANTKVIIEQAQAYAHRGSIRGMRQNLKEGIRDCEHAVEMLREITEDSPNVRQTLADAYNLLGSVQADEHLGNFADAVGPFTHVVEHYRQAVEDEPRRTFGRRELARAVNNLGRAKFAARDVDGSIVLFNEALELRRKLYEENPDVGAYQSDLISSYDRLGLVYGRIEESDRAAELFREAIELQTDLVARHSEVEAYKRTLANLWYKRGFQQQRAKKTDDSDQSYAKAFELAEEFIATFEASEENHRFIAEISNNIGGIFRGKGRHDAAREQFHRAVAAARDLAKQYGESNDTLNLIGVYQTNLGNLESDAGNLPASLAAHDLAIPAFEKILAKNSDHGPGKLGLYNAHRSRGTVLTKADRHGEAVLAWEQARKLAPAEHTTYVTQCHGVAMAEAGQHIGAAEAAEQLITGESLKFYYKLPKGPALLKHLAAGILAIASKKASNDESLCEEERKQFADKHGARAVELLNEAHSDGLYETTSYQTQLKSHVSFDSLRERADFQALVDQFPTESSP